LRARTTRPINANFFCHAAAPADPGRADAWRRRLEPYWREFRNDAFGAAPPVQVPPFDNAMCQMVEAARPEVVSFHFGLPAPSLLARIKSAGCRVMSSATTVAEARWLEDDGADIVIAQGYDAGGHWGMFLATDLAREIVSQPGTMALVPQVVDAVRVPVVAAGGIADARGIAAAFALGAAGVQLGTAYLRCPEAGTSPLHREALESAGADSTVMTSAFTGRPARALVNRFTREIAPFAAEAPAFPDALSVLLPLRMAAERHGNTDFTPLWAGQTAPLATAQGGEELTRALASGGLHRLRELAK
jgi:nitronate monooxygenase